MADIYPANLRYTKDHEWAKRIGDAIAVGVTHHAQDSLGALVYVELPAVGTAVTAGTSFGVIESTKAVSELYSPITGTVARVNAAASADPSSINADPHAVWLIEISPSSPAEFDALLDQPAYLKVLESVK